MSTYLSRRGFIRTAAIGSAGLITAPYIFSNAFAKGQLAAGNNLYTLSNDLMLQWATALLKLQVTDQNRVDDFGGIFCPYDQTIHGRVGDTIYPLLHLAGKTNDQKYVDSARQLYQWIERRVSQPDGSWLNEPVAGSWKGTTVFMSIALAEAIKNHGSVIDSQWKTAMMQRLVKAGDYIFENFNMAYGNINYPVTAAYGLSLLGDVLDVQRFRQRGTELAKDALKYFSTNNKLLFGEGDIDKGSPKGCYAVDLGYNVEESLPALVMYGLLRNDEEVLQTVTQSMQQHMEFMLPDGGWDNSWGTRNYKWTYWGSRTSDGCQSAYALMAHRDPRFYRVALKNTQLMQQCTFKGLLQGGLHNARHGVTPCVHHTFSHIKALSTMLDYANDKHIYSNVKLPREEHYGSRYFEDLDTFLISKEGFKATVTGYDKEYKKYKNGHATGGALSMLWHPAAGPIFCGSMNEYQIFEAGNQQADVDHAMTLTPRIELQQDGHVYMNISNLRAEINKSEVGLGTLIHTKSELVDKDQQSPASGPVNCQVDYHFVKGKMFLRFRCDHPDARIILPVISSSDEKVTITDQTVTIRKERCILRLTANHAITSLTANNQRIFNYVPGLEAVPIAISGKDVKIEISCR